MPSPIQLPLNMRNAPRGGAMIVEADRCFLSSLKLSAYPLDERVAVEPGQAGHKERL